MRADLIQMPERKHLFRVGSISAPDDSCHVWVDAGVVAAIYVRSNLHGPFAKSSRRNFDPRGVIEKQTRGVSPLLNAHPLSPNELTQFLSSTRSRFSVLSVMRPSAPARTAAVFDPPPRPKRSLPFTSIPSSVRGAGLLP